jgi:hypothetical protein
MAIPFRQIRDEPSNGRFASSDLDGRTAERADRSWRIGDIDGEVTPDARSQSIFLTQCISQTSFIGGTSKAHSTNGSEVRKANSGKPVLAMAPNLVNRRVPVTPECDAQLSAAAETIHELAAHIAAEIETLRKRLSPVAQHKK